jgi:hypothetical protein
VLSLADGLLAGQQAALATTAASLGIVASITWAAAAGGGAGASGIGGARRDRGRSGLPSSPMTGVTPALGIAATGGSGAGSSSNAGSTSLFAAAASAAALRGPRRLGARPAISDAMPASIVLSYLRFPG